jgi:acyl-CoA reductase-like NAD-dependent aldehyde dehydrogenase
MLQISTRSTAAFISKSPNFISKRAASNNNTKEKMTIPTINNYIHGKKKKQTNASNALLLVGDESSPASYMTVTSPSTSIVVAHVYTSTKEDVEEAIESSKKALDSWSQLTIKSRVAILLKFNYLVKLHAQELAELIVQENGKNITEGK